MSTNNRDKFEYQLTEFNSLTGEIQTNARMSTIGKPPPSTKMSSHESSEHFNLRKTPTNDLKIKLAKQSRNQTTTPVSGSLGKPMQLKSGIALGIFILAANLIHLIPNTGDSSSNFIQSVGGHIVLTKDDHGQSLVLTGEDGKGGKGKGGKGGGGGGDQLVIAGSGMGESGQDSKMIMQDASNREGDVVINGNSMIIPGEDGHIVLSDSRRRSGGGGGRYGDGGGGGQMQFNPLIFWLPYMSNRFPMFPFYGGGAGGQFG